MKKIEHSFGWHVVKEMTTKIKRQRVIIVILMLLWVLSVLMCCTGGK